MNSILLAVGLIRYDDSYLLGIIRSYRCRYNRHRMRTYRCDDNKIVTLRRLMYEITLLSVTRHIAQADIKVIV